MLIVYLFFILTISTTAGDIPFRGIYSAWIHNQQFDPVECYVVWLKPSGDTARTESFTIEVNEDYLVDEYLILTGAKTVYLEMKEVHCGKFVLKAPFDGADGVKTNWDFYVREDQILSGEQE